MYFPTMEYRLELIERRRRYRRWVLALQIVMVVFFVDQILRTWCRARVIPAVEQASLAHSTLQLAHVVNKQVHRSEQDPLSDRITLMRMKWLTAAAFCLLLSAAYLRRQGSTMEVYGIALMLGGSLSRLVDIVRTSQVFDCLLISLGRGRYFPFSLADLAIAFGAYCAARAIVHQFWSGQSLDVPLSS